MYAFIKLFLDIAIFKKGPQDIPASPWMLRITLPVYAGINLLILFINDNAGTAILQILVDFLLMVSFCWPLLYFSGKTNRFSRTLCALIGTDAVIGFFSIPAVISLGPQSEEWVFLSLLAMMFWHWLVSAHIFRHALDKPLFFGLGLSLLYILISSQVMALLFPVISTTS